MEHMDRRRRHRLRRGLAVIMAVGLLFTATGTQTAFAKRKKTTAKKKAKKKTAAATTKKKATAGSTATTARPAGPVARGTIKIGVLGTSISATTGVRTPEESRKIAQAWEKRINTA